MKILFNVDNDCYCTTPCPYGFTDGYTGEPKKVGSNGCSECAHFVDIDTENNSIECCYKD